MFLKDREFFVCMHGCAPVCVHGCVFVAMLSGVVVCFRCCAEWSCGAFSLLC